MSRILRRGHQPSHHLQGQWLKTSDPSHLQTNRLKDHLWEGLKQMLRHIKQKASRMKPFAITYNILKCVKSSRYATFFWLPTTRMCNNIQQPKKGKTTCLEHKNTGKKTWKKHENNRSFFNHHTAFLTPRLHSFLRRHHTAAIAEQTFARKAKAAGHAKGGLKVGFTFLAITPVNCRNEKPEYVEHTWTYQLCWVVLLLIKRNSLNKAMLFRDSGPCFRTFSSNDNII